MPSQTWWFVIVLYICTYCSADTLLPTPRLYSSRINCRWSIRCIWGSGSQDLLSAFRPHVSYGQHNSLRLHIQYGVYLKCSVVGSATAEALGACANNVFHVFHRFLCAWGLDDILYMGLCNLLPCKQKLHHDFVLLRVFYSPDNNIPLLFIYVPGHKTYWQVSSVVK